ncbi:MAG: signal peptidase II [Byssovorax sp.]
MQSDPEQNPPGPPAGTEATTTLLSGVSQPEGSPGHAAPPAAIDPPAALPPPAQASAEIVPRPAYAVDPAGPASASARKPASMTLLVVVTVVSLAADLASKWWAKSHLSGYDTKARTLKKFEVIKDHVDFIFAQNPGGAWSFLRGLPDTLRRPFFLVVSASAIVFIVSIYRRVHADQRAMKWGLPLALGGAMGNLVDRIRYGWVVDFVDVYLKRGGREHHWPTFNVADIAIVVGVLLMAIDMIGSRGHRPRMLDLHDTPAPAPPAPIPPAA